MSGRRLSTLNFNGRLSMREIRSLTQSRRRSSQFSRSAQNGAPIERARSFAGAGDLEAGGDENNEEKLKTGLEAVIPWISLILHVPLFAYFLSAAILVSLANRHHHGKYNDF